MEHSHEVEVYVFAKGICNEPRRQVFLEWFENEGLPAIERQEAEAMRFCVTLLKGSPEIVLS